MAASNFALARQSLEQALAADPKAQYAQFLYGLMAYLENDMQAALPRFQKAHQLNPADPRATLYLAITTESLGQIYEAMALCEEAVRLEPSADNLLPGARLLLLLDRLDESERSTRQALKLSPKLRDSHFELARLLLRKAKPPKPPGKADSPSLSPAESSPTHKFTTCSSAPSSKAATRKRHRNTPPHSAPWRA